ncbi:conjugal transfer protein TraG N-terminal domain-containing protein [Pasteurella multocida]|uniref:conjugal transfer protein TraG N-terminal domain-containing protein n=1 Tax=Pasteurella multocida TaxID=747 RepID=UPI002FE0E3C1
MALEITVMGGIDVVAQTFNAIATLVNNDTWFSLMAIAETLGIVMCIIKYIRTHDLKVMGFWLLAFVVINAILLTPKTDIVVTDLTEPTKIKKIDNVPVGVALPFYLSTDIGNGLARTYDMFFAQPDELQYTKTGLLFGQRLIDDSFYLSSSSGEINQNLGNYTKSCLVPDIQLNQKYTFDSLLKSQNLIDLIFSHPSEVRHMSYIKNGITSFQTCKTAARELKDAINSEINTGNNSGLKGLLARYGIGGVKTHAVLNNTVQQTYDYLMGVSKSAVEIYKQNIIANTLRRHLDKYPASLDGSSDMIAVASEQSLNKMKLAHLSSYNIAGKMLPALHTTFMVLLVGVFPIMVLAMFIMELSVSIVKNYVSVLFSLMMWPVLFAVFNSIINILTYQQLNGEPFTLSTADKIKDNMATLAGVASWLMLSIPFISFRLTTALGQSIASAGSYLGNALASATSADAASVASGNFSWGNMQMQNINGFKTNLNQVTDTGMISTRLSNGAMQTSTADGTVIYESNLSKLPFNFSFGKMLDASLASAAQALNRQSEVYHQGYRSATTQAHDAASQILNNYSHQELRQKGLSEHQINAIEGVAQNSRGAKESYNASDDTSRTHSTETSYNKNASAGLGTSGSFGSIGGALGVNDTNKDGVSLKTGASYHSNSDESWTNTESARRVKNFDESQISNINDSTLRSLVKTVSTSTREAHENFSGFTASQAREKVISETANMTESQRLNIEHNLQQEFANYARTRLGEEEAGLVLTSGTAEARMKRTELLAEYQQHFENALRDINNHNIDNVLGSYQNNSNRGETYSPVNSNVFGNSDTLKTPEELGLKSTIEQLDKNNPGNEEVRYGYVKKEGFNKAIHDSFKDVSNNIEKQNNRIYDDKK